MLILIGLKMKLKQCSGVLKHNNTKL